MLLYQTHQHLQNQEIQLNLLLEDIKKLTDVPSKVLAILEKGVDDNNIYSTVKHVAKGLNLNNITLPDEIKQLISLENYIYKGKQRLKEQQRKFVIFDIEDYERDRAEVINEIAGS